MTTVNIRHASRSSRLLLTRVPKSGKHMAEPRRSIGADPGDLKGVRILLVEARFYDDIADELLEGATRVLEPPARSTTA